MTAPAALQHARFDPARLRGARRAAGLTLEKVGAVVDRHWVTVAKYERGEIDLPVSVLGALAELYGVHPGELFAPPPDRT